MTTTKTLHELKSEPSYFQAVWDGDKTFEVRYDDRGYQKGDRILLREYDPHTDCSCRQTTRFHLDDCPRYTGRYLGGEIGFVVASTASRGSVRGFNGNGYVVFSLLLSDSSDPELTKELQA